MTKVQKRIREIRHECEWSESDHVWARRRLEVGSFSSTFTELAASTTARDVCYRECGIASHNPAWEAHVLESLPPTPAIDGRARRALLSELVREVCPSGHTLTHSDSQSEASISALRPSGHTLTHSVNQCSVEKQHGLQLFHNYPSSMQIMHILNRFLDEPFPAEHFRFDSNHLWRHRWARARGSHSR